MKETIAAKLKEVLKLSDEQAEKAAESVMDIINSEGAKGIKDKLGGMAGGLFGGDKKDDE